MTIKELKNIIADMDDDTIIVLNTNDGNTSEIEAYEDCEHNLYITETWYHN